MSKVRILLIESNQFLREAIPGILAEQKEVEIVAATDYVEAIEKAKAWPPNIFLVDLALVYKTNLSNVRLLKSEFPHSLVITIDLTPMQSDIIEYINAGVSGFVLRDATLDEFIHTIKLVATGQKKVLAPLVPTTLHSRIVEHAVKSGDGHIPPEPMKLTLRELEIVDQVVRGLSNKEIATELNIAVHTVKTHIHNMLEKLSLRSRLELSNFAHTRGLSNNSRLEHLRIEKLTEGGD